MATEKQEAIATHVDHETHDSQLGHLANQEDHELSKWQAIKTKPQAFLWCMFAVWTILLTSYENQASGIYLGIPQFRKDFGTEFDGNWVLPAEWQSAFNGAPVASTIVGALGAAQIADWIGRKWTIVGSLVISYAAISLELVSVKNSEFFGGKFLNGFSVGILATICVTYIGEVVPHPLRGMMTCLTALAYTVGPFVCSLILNKVGTMESRWAYRALFCSQYGFAVVSTVLVPFMPESPWWLANNNKDERALDSLRKLGYRNGEENKRLANIKLTLEEIKQETEGASYLECFRKSNLRRTIISIAPLSIQALSGVSWVAGYATYYIQLAGYSDQMSFRLGIVQQVCSMVGNVMSWYLVDRIGRRDLTFWGMFVLTIMLFVAGGLACATGNSSAIRGVVAMIQLYCWWYNVTIGATAYTLLTEVATARLRAKTIAIGFSLQNGLYLMCTNKKRLELMLGLFKTQLKGSLPPIPSAGSLSSSHQQFKALVYSFVLPYLFNPDKANLGAKVSFIFGGLCILCLVYLYIYQPETAHRSYEELDELFMKRVPARRFKGYETDAEMKGRMVKEQGGIKAI